MKTYLIRMLSIPVVSGLLLGLIQTPTIVKSAETTTAGNIAQSPQDAWNVEYVSQLGGGTQSVAVQGNYAYVGVGPRLIILDISITASPVEVGKTLPLPGIVWGVAISGNYAYLAVGDAGLRIVNISNPANPVETGFFDTPGFARDLVISDPFAYVADDDAGLRVVNISNPYNPIEAGFYDSPGLALDVDVLGSYAYMADRNSGLRVVNISNPAYPYEVGSLDINYSENVTVSGGYAYVSAVTIDGDGLWVVNISNPAYPHITGFYQPITPPPPAHHARGVAVLGIYAYIAYEYYGLRVLNISNPHNPIEDGFVDTPAYSTDVAVSGVYAYVVDLRNGLRLVNVSNPANPYQVASYATIGKANNVDVMGNYAYLAEYGGIRAVNISTPDNPYSIGFNDTPADARSLTVTGGYAYVARGELWVMNISNPANPYPVGSYFDAPDWVKDVQVSGGYAYAAGTPGLRVVDVSNPSYPYLVGFLDLPGSYGALGVAISENFAYVANGRRLDIVNISIPNAPYLVGSNDLPSDAFDVVVAGDHAYVADHWSGLRVVNVSNPAIPYEVGFYETPGTAVSVAVSGDYAYVADSQAGLRVVNVSNPAEPYEVGFYNTPDSTRGVSVSGGYVYVADYNAGLFILKFANSITGRVTNSDGNPLPGVTVTAGTGYSAVTDSQGYYQINNVLAGNYFVTPNLSGYAFYPVMRSISVPPDAVGQDFIGTPIKIERFEVNQVLGEQKDSEQNYVAGKATALRVFLNVPIQTSTATQKITVRRDGETVTTLYPQPEIFPTDELNFLCGEMSECGNWQAGSYTFDIIVNGVALHTGTFDFVESRLLRILAVPVRIRVDGEIKEPDPSWKTAHEFLGKVYPIPFDDLEWVEAPTLNATYLDLTSDTGRYLLLLILNAYQNPMCGLPLYPPCYDQIVGFIDNICEPEEACEPGWTHPWLTTVAGVMTIDEVDAIVAHEIGHNYGLGDEYDNMCGAFECEFNPPPPNYCGRDGISEECTNDFQCVNSTATPWPGNGSGSMVIASQDHPYDVTERGTLGNLLSFMGSGETMDNSWITPDIYHHLFGKLVPENIALSAPIEIGRVIQASGMIGKDGSVELLPWVVITTTLPATITGTYSIDALDAFDQVLASQGFDVSYLLLSDPPSDLDSAPFQAVLPFPPGTAAFQTKHGDEVLSRIEVSGNAPEVTVISPNGGQNWGPTGDETITWSGSNADGDTLYYTVLYTPNGSDWVTLSANITSTQTTVALDEIPGGDQAKFRVIATDGINTSVDESDDTFVVGDKGPSAYILSPSTQTMIPNGTTFYLHGYGYDLEDGRLGETSLTWNSSRDGYLGAGSLLLVNLSHGDHMITLTATDSKGAQSTDVISLYIGSKAYLPVCIK